MHEKHKFCQQNSKYFITLLIDKGWELGDK